jgi:hypothetical protein
MKTLLLLYSSPCLISIDRGETYHWGGEHSFWFGVPVVKPNLTATGSLYRKLTRDVKHKRDKDRLQWYIQPLYETFFCFGDYLSKYGTTFVHCDKLSHFISSSFAVNEHLRWRMLGSERRLFKLCIPVECRSAISLVNLSPLATRGTPGMTS